jgi:hypothetical protein
MPEPVMAACHGDATAMTATSRAKIAAMMTMTASILARRT